MLETVKKYISELPDTSFNDYYQQYIFSIQDENLGLETQFADNTFNSIGRLLAKIHKELGNIK